MSSPSNPAQIWHMATQAQAPSQPEHRDIYYISRRGSITWNQTKLPEASEQREYEKYSELEFLRPEHKLPKETELEKASESVATDSRLTMM